LLLYQSILLLKVNYHVNHFYFITKEKVE